MDPHANPLPLLPSFYRFLAYLPISQIDPVPVPVPVPDWVALVRKPLIFLCVCVCVCAERDVEWMKVLRFEGFRSSDIRTRGRGAVYGEIPNKASKQGAWGFSG